MVVQRVVANTQVAESKSKLQQEFNRELTESEESIKQTLEVERVDGAERTGMAP